MAKITKEAALLYHSQGKPGKIEVVPTKPYSTQGKGLLFKIYAGIDVFDIEVDEKDPDKFIEAVKAIAPTFGGINLEDIKAPECFEIERRLKEELDIPVMHDDQHGTAIISSAGLVNALQVAGKKIEDVKKYNVDVFVMGDDWKGKFDFLKDYCEVVYLPRTEGISTTQLKEELKG